MYQVALRLKPCPQITFNQTKTLSYYDFIWFLLSEEDKSHPTGDLTLTVSVLIWGVLPCSKLNFLEHILVVHRSSFTTHSYRDVV